MPRRRGLSPRRFVSTACSLRYGGRRNRIGKTRKNSVPLPRRVARAALFFSPCRRPPPFLPPYPFYSGYAPRISPCRYPSFPSPVGFFGRKGRLPRRFRRFEVHSRENSSFLRKRNFPGKASERACLSAPSKRRKTRAAPERDAEQREEKQSPNIQDNGTRH